MRSAKIRFLVIVVLIAAFFVLGAGGQTIKSEIRNNIVVVEQPDCPMRLVPAPTVQTPFLLKFRNDSDRAVEAMVVLREHPRYNGLEVMVTGRPFEPGKDTNWNVGVLSDTTLSFDYVLFADGTSWGPDRFERSRVISDVLAARAAVLGRLTELARGYSDPQDFAVRPEDFGGLHSLDAAGALNPLKREQHIIIAWETVINRLRRNTRRPVEAHELADMLETEKPQPSNADKDKPQQPSNP